MQELIKALTRLANVVAEHYEKTDNPQMTLPLVVDAMPGSITVAVEPPAVKTRKPRTPKAETPAPAAAEAGAVAEELTEAESAKAALEFGGLVCQRFSNPSARVGADGKQLVGRDGKPVVEGFYLAKDMLAQDFKVAKVADLVHAQRLQFIAKCKALLAKADTQPAPAVGVGL